MKTAAVCSVGQRKSYNGIDLVKFLCAIMVFTVHIRVFEKDAFKLANVLNFGFQKCVCRVAVPFFFVSSGFFLFRKMDLKDLKTDVIRDYCFKILRMLGIWTVVLMAGAKGHLWYMGAAVVAVVLLTLCLRVGMKLRYIYPLAFLLYLVGLMGDSYHGFLKPFLDLSAVRYAWKGYVFFFNSTRNGVFMGFIFVLMGATFARYDIKIRPVTALIGFLGSMLCLVGEASLLEYHKIPLDYNMYLSLLPAVFFLFCFACSIELKDHGIYKRLRTVGVLIYYLHMVVDKCFGLGAYVVRGITGINLRPFRFLISLLLTLALAVLLEWLSRKNYFKWLRWLVS